MRFLDGHKEASVYLWPQLATETHRSLHSSSRIVFPPQSHPTEMAQQRAEPPPLTKSEIVKEYLTAYNSVCALLWFSIFGRVVLLIPITGYESIYEAAGDITKWTQTVAVLEILHSAFGGLDSITTSPSSSNVSRHFHSARGD